MIVGSNLLRLAISGGRPQVGDSDVPLELFFDGLKRVVFAEDQDDTERLGPGDLVVALGGSAGRTTDALREVAGRLAEKGVVGLLVHERALDPVEITPETSTGPFPLVLIDKNVEWGEVLQPLIRIETTLRGGFDSESRRAELAREILASEGKISIEDDRARDAGLDLSAPMRVFYVAPVDDVPRTAAARLEEAIAFELVDHDPNGTVIQLGSAIVALETATDPVTVGRDRVGNSLLFGARGSAGTGDVMLGSGRYRSGADGIFRSFREARWAAETGYCLHGPNHVTDFDSLGAFAWLEPIDFDRGSEATHAIQQIITRDREQGTRLLETLQAFLETRRLKEAADRLFIHRNTLRYRLDAIRKLTGLDVQDPSSRLVLELQMRLAMVRRLIGRGALPERGEAVIIDLVREPSEPILDLTTD